MTLAPKWRCSLMISAKSGRSLDEALGHRQGDGHVDHLVDVAAVHVDGYVALADELAQMAVGRVGAARLGSAKPHGQIEFLTLQGLHSVLDRLFCLGNGCLELLV